MTIRQLVLLTVMVASVPVHAAALGGPDAAKSLRDPIPIEAPSRAPRADPVSELADYVQSEFQENNSPLAIPKAVVRHMRAAGFAAAYAPREFLGFEENVSLTFSYHVGDLDVDGWDDVVVASYCLHPDACDEGGGGLVPELGGPTVEGEEPCGSTGRLAALSGRTGEVFWSRPMNTENRSIDLQRIAADPGSRLLCHLDFIIGPVPLQFGEIGIMVYSWQAGLPFYGDQHQQIPISNLIEVIHPRNASRIWHTNILGEVVVAHIYRPPLPVWYHWHVRNLVVNPLLFAHGPDGLPTTPEEGQDTLFLQGVGYEWNTVAWADLPGEEDCLGCDGINVYNHYMPNEWVSRIDLPDFEERWNRRTFQPDPRLSVIPDHLQRAPAPMFPAPPHVDDPFWWAPVHPPREHEARTDWYWNQRPCCFDNTGDGVPDIPFVVKEFEPSQRVKLDGPRELNLRLDLLDGATGDFVWSVYLEKNVPRFAIAESRCCFNLAGVTALFSSAGDANGDGRGDLLVHTEFNEINYRNTWRMINGADGSTLWSKEFGRRTYALVIGDADRDGGHDVVTLTWTAWEFPFPRVYHQLNVTKTFLGAWNGATGARLWNTSTFNAPGDLAAMYWGYRTNGMPDLDADGVGDLMIDDPAFLADLTVIHRLKVISGRNAAPIHEELPAVGAFTFPLYVGQVTGDTVDDFALLNGDPNDIWLTMYDGANGTALWSRRLLAIPLGEALSAFPKVRVHPLNTPSGRHAPLINLHFDAAVSPVAPNLIVTYPKLAAFGGEASTIRWAHPIETDVLATGVTGSSPATQAYLLAIAAGGTEPAVLAVAMKWHEAGGLQGLALFFGFGLVGALVGPWRWKK